MVIKLLRPPPNATVFSSPETGMPDPLNLQRRPCRRSPGFSLPARAAPPVPTYIPLDSEFGGFEPGLIDTQRRPPHLLPQGRAQHFAHALLLIFAKADPDRKSEQTL